MNAEIKPMPRLSSAGADKQYQSPAAAYGLLIILTVIISASEFLLYSTIQFEIKQTLLLVVIAVPAAMLVATFKVQKPLLKQVSSHLTFILLFSLWSIQIYLSHQQTALMTATGIILLVLWYANQTRHAHWIALFTTSVMLGVLYYSGSMGIKSLAAYALLLLAPIAFLLFNQTANNASLQTAKAKLRVNTTESEEAELDIYDDFSEPQATMVHMENGKLKSDWERALRELYSELHTIADVDKLFNKTLEFLNNTIEIDATAVGMIQDRAIKKIAKLDQSNFLRSKLLDWSGNRMKQLMTDKKEVVSTQDYIDDEGKSINLYRIDIPVLSNMKVVGLVSLLRTSTLFDEYDAKLASSIVFHSMVALRHARLQEELKRLSSGSKSTTLYSREQFVEKTKVKIDELSKARAFSLLIIEVDNFNSVSDKYGHTCITNLYKKIASTILGAINADDFLGRYGKEGFILLLDETDLLEAQELAENIRAKIASIKLKAEQGVISTTVSIGLTAVSEQDEDVPSLIRKADMGLFVAKESGSNTVKVSL